MELVKHYITVANYEHKMKQAGYQQGFIVGEESEVPFWFKTMTVRSYQQNDDRYGIAVPRIPSQFTRREVKIKMILDTEELFLVLQNDQHRPKKLLIDKGLEKGIIEGYFLEPRYSYGFDGDTEADVTFVSN